jgi:uncharacterized protein YkwD
VRSTGQVLPRLLGATLLVIGAVVSAQGASSDNDHSFGPDALSAINRYRQEKNLSPLKVDYALINLATRHSAAMAEKKALSHSGFDARYAESGRRLCLENVGWNYPTPEEQVAAWRLSKGHDRNMLHPTISRAGIARIDGYVTFFACD